VPNALRIFCPNEQCAVLIGLLERGAFNPLRARIVFGGNSQTLICTECGAQRQWLPQRLERMVTWRPKT
jgi:hypothetical protein